MHKSDHDWWLYLKTSGLWSYSTCMPVELSLHLVAVAHAGIKQWVYEHYVTMSIWYLNNFLDNVPSPRSTRNSFFSSGVPGVPRRKFSGFTSPWTYLFQINIDLWELQNHFIYKKLFLHDITHISKNDSYFLVTSNFHSCYNPNISLLDYSSSTKGTATLHPRENTIKEKWRNCFWINTPNLPQTTQTYGKTSLARLAGGCNNQTSKRPVLATKS